MNPRESCLLLTGSINPKDVFSLKRSDPAVRENDYYDAIIRWLRLNIPLVFCENSNYDSEKIKSISNPNFEYLRYEEDEDLSQKGKGWGEYLIMKYAHEHSQIIKKTSFVIKITGRLYIRNFRKILASAEQQDFDVMAPLENNLKWTDSRMIIYYRGFFDRYFTPYASQINDSSGLPFERALAFAIHALLADNKKWEMPPCYPKYQGYSGTHNKRYTLFYKWSVLKWIRFPLLKYLIRL